MSLLLPQSRAGVLRAIRPVDIHGDRWVDLAVDLEDGVTTTGRLAASELPADLAPGDRVSVRFVMGQMTKVERAAG